MAGTDYAIIVGIDHYPELGALRGPVHDATAFRDWLLDPDGGAVPQDHIYFITTPDNVDPQQDFLDATPTYDQVSNAFLQIFRIALKIDNEVGRRLYLFFSGHGYSMDIDSASLIMANAHKLLSIPGFPSTEAANQIRKTGMFEEVVLFMDCCRDDLPRVEQQLPPWLLSSDASGAEVKHFFGFATQWSRKAREKLTENGQITGLFTRALLEGLRRAQANDSQNLNGSGLAAFVRNFLQEDPLNAEKQIPVFRYDTGLEIVFREGLPHMHTKVVFEIPDGVTGELVVSNGRTEIARVKINGVPTEAQLEPGLYKAEIIGTPLKTLFEVAGKEVENVGF